ncbi:MAG: FKBP-type peptidyl-prolyl cis-trans isomerase [Bacteroidetes bacterium]|nr:FKBP-type peptidyl-prolyl cis-trans isomerase [Bacteroidota bacterium]
MKKLVIAFIFCASVILIHSCGSSQNKTTKNTDLGSKAFQDKLIDANKMYVKKESDEIDQYVKRKGWDMNKTGTGLRYMIIKKGTGVLANEDSSFNKFAKVKFQVSLLDGTICYSSDSTGLREFMVGQDDVETGLHEGIQYMHVGDVAKFILPSHLAYGLMGDQRKIPPKSPVLYDIELLSLRKSPKK